MSDGKGSSDFIAHIIFPLSGDYLVMHLSELVRTSFIAATASVDQLKLAGYEALRVCVHEHMYLHSCFDTLVVLYDVSSCVVYVGCDWFVRCHC